MATLELVLVLLAAVLISAVIDQLVPKVSLPLIQIALGILVSLIAGSQINIEFDPNLFLVLFIAPLLYYDAREANKTALMRNIKPILVLAVGLVVITSLIVGFVTHSLIPSIPLTAAIALGAALAPTDAVAVASLPQEKLNERHRSILEGESLLNDASGIVIFQFAISTSITGAFSLVDASVSFAVSFFGGIVVGIIMGLLTTWLGNYVRTIGLENTTFHVLFDLFTPFIVFLTANAFGVSGVMAVVLAGIISSLSYTRFSPTESRLNIMSTSVWRVLSFALNGFVFVLLGTQLPKAMQSSWDNVSIANTTLIVLVLLITIAVLLCRFVCLLLMEYTQKGTTQHKPAESKNSAPEAFRSAAIMTLAGMKGAITLSVMLTIPVVIGEARLFPQRHLLIFLACGVILVVMLLSTFVLPLLLPKTKTKQDALTRAEHEKAVQADILRNVVEDLANTQTDDNHSATQIVIQSYRERIEGLKAEQDEETPELKEIRKKALKWQEAYIEHEKLTQKIPEDYAAEAMYRIQRRERVLRHTFDGNSLITQLNSYYMFFKSFIHKTTSSIPGIELERADTIRTLRIGACSYAIVKLTDLLGETNEFSAENITIVLNEYNQLLASLKASIPSISRISAVSEAALDVQRKALSLELDYIQAALREETISRGYAKRLRENVALMQIDLEDKL